jgi:(p)ppGpp synthase/HD superfamily hydrolase
MHKEAEYGIAAHWFYDEKKGLTSQIKDFFWKQKKEKQIP